MKSLIEETLIREWIETSHGRRSIDTLQLYDPSKANWEC